jgi:hypothetical protein
MNKRLTSFLLGMLTVIIIIPIITEFVEYIVGLFEILKSKSNVKIIKNNVD